MIKLAEIVNPKRGVPDKSFEGWYPYYAGYSTKFVTKLLVTSKVNSKSTILDPWNGSGTTTTVANNLGICAHGFDLNPVMVLAAKSCLVSRHDYTSLKPIAYRIVDLAKTINLEIQKEEPLLIWFRSVSALTIRNIERAIQILLFDQHEYKLLANHQNLDHVSSIAAFFYVALFRTINNLLISFKATNPTWIKVPKKAQNKKGPSVENIYTTFFNEVKVMVDAVRVENINSRQGQYVDICIGNSSSLKVDSNSIDFVISSPPYCTRIDYAVATMPELTLLGYEPNSSFDSLRRRLIGASTVPRVAPEAQNCWGEECNRFLASVHNHESKASKTYYYKNHTQYFDSIFKSIVEIERVLKNSGVCTLVVQDSHYKDVYNNLPLIITQMAWELGLGLVREEHFSSNRHMAKLNPEVKKYRTQINAIESVLCFQK
jgi:DNA modification methylase